MWSRLLKTLSNREKNSSRDASIFSSKNKKILVIILTSLLPILLVIIAIVLIVFLPILLIQQYLFDAKADGPTLFTNVAGHLVLNEWCKENDLDCTKQSTQMFYERIEQVNNEYQEKGKSIDVELLTATIYYGKTLDEELFNEEGEEETTLDIIAGAVRLSDVNKLASNMINENRIDYTKYRNYLINTYIPKRFSDMYEDASDKDAEIERIADEIMAFASLEDQSLVTNTLYGSCKYNTSGNEMDTTNLQVVLVSCDGNSELERVDFETYIKGVVYGEVGNTWPAEVLKAQAVATRSYTLTRNQTMCPGRPNNCEYGYNPNKKEIRMRNCEGDQVYCDYKNGCQKYNYNGYNSLISGTKNPSLKIYKEALSENDAANFENILNEVNGKVLTKEDNTVYASAYIDTDQRAWNSMYASNNSMDYNEILVKHYWTKANENLTINSNCTNFGTIGEFAEWKQFDPRWGSINIGSDTLSHSGCLVTSIAIQFARSGTVNIPAFDPGIFANELTKHGGFSPSGALYWAPLRTTINNLSNGRFVAANLDVYLSGTRDNKISTLQQYLNSGYLLVLGVKHEGHWVAVNKIENNKVYIFDPGDSYVTEVSQKYSWEGVTKVQLYQVSP